MRGQSRKGDNLWTCSIVALNPDTGKLAWWFPGLAARHPRLGQRRRAGSVRWRDQRADAQTAGTGRAQRLLLRSRSHQWQERSYRALCRCELVEGRQLAAAADSQSGQRTQNRRRAGVSPPPGERPIGRRPASIRETGLFYVTASPSYSVYYLTDTSDTSGRLWRPR